MRQRALRPAAALGLLILCSIGTSALPAAQKAVSASDAWIKLPAAGDTTATAFAVIDNPTMYDVYLVSASSEIAAEVSFVDASPAGRDTSVKEIAAPAYGKIALTATGVHLVLKGLKRPLTAGQTVALTIVTDGGVAIVLSANVRTQ
jgi:periplasmic copper chaperone A